MLWSLQQIWCSNPSSKAFEMRFYRNSPDESLFQEHFWDPLCDISSQILNCTILKAALTLNNLTKVAYSTHTVVTPVQWRYRTAKKHLFCFGRYCNSGKDLSHSFYNNSEQRMEFHVFQKLREDCPDHSNKYIAAFLKKIIIISDMFYTWFIEGSFPKKWSARQKMIFLVKTSFENQTLRNWIGGQHGSEMF